jgi:hypothetical protein
MISIINPAETTYFIAYRDGGYAGCGTVTPAMVMESGADAMDTFTDRSAYIAAMSAVVGEAKVREFLYGPPLTPPAIPEGHNG